MKNGDIVFARTGATVGKSYLIEKLSVESIYASYLIRIRTSQQLNPKYIKYFFGSLCYWNQITDKSSGIGQPNVNGTSLANLYIPIPPYDEQGRILPAIEKSFALIDSLETDKSDLQTAIRQAKSKILNLAIHGKLVSQDSSDEPASVLLEKLRAEKEAKIKAGELKRDKNDSYIYKNTTDNCYYQKFNKGDGLLIQEKIKFEIPEGWSWCLLRNICSDFIVPQRDKPTRFDGTIPWCRIEDIEGKYLNGSLSNQLVSMKTIKAMNMHICPKGSIICSCSASIGVQAIATVDCCTNQTFIGIVPIEKALFNEYLYYFLGSQTKYFHEIATGTTIKYISRDKFEDFIFPLPPLAEQKRIVEKIENAFAKLDQIAEQLA